MVRLSLVDWLANHLGAKHKNLLYELVFAFTDEDKANADDQATQQNLWPRLDTLLINISILDPACGSGSFLVGALYVLNDLIARAEQQLGRQQTPYERKKRIIGQSLYGVDAMDWAVHVAELRLWLQLVIDTELQSAELKFRPLLPDLSFNIRPGDSLVQEVGGINLAMRKGGDLIPTHIQGRITQLKGQKLKFYHNDPSCKYRSAEQLRHEEVQLFRALLDERAKAIDTRIKQIESQLKPQVNLFGEMQPTQMHLDRLALEREREQLLSEREQVQTARRALQAENQVPFVWDIAFVEIFEGEKKGFDIVLGNPPYVRQEQIRDPRQQRAEATTASKKAYKDKLMRSVYAAWPQTFGFNLAKDTVQWKLDAKSDLYIYFYFHGLSLLNAQGVFCFITSNSWLDVGYGQDLQEFLLTRGQVKIILDNQARRSFASADVNTVIVLLGSARDLRVGMTGAMGIKGAIESRRYGGGRGVEAQLIAPPSADHIARFVMLTVPYEAALSPVIWEEVEEATQRTTTPEYRVFPVSQKALLDSGMAPEKQSFAGDKWGGKYLRAPDIYWTILEKGKGKLVRLGEIAEVRFGIKTGANEFFYLDEQKTAAWGIEEEFLRPVIKSPRECKRIVIDERDLENKIFLCRKTKPELKGTAALEYILWGESQNFHKRPSCAGRARWWELGERRIPPIVSPSSVNSFYRVHLNPKELLIDKRLYEVHISNEWTNSLTVSANCSLSSLFLELGSRTALGGGLLDMTVYEIADCLVIDPTMIADIRLFDRPLERDIHSEILRPDRRALDNAVFDVLGLTSGERDAVYEAVIRLVDARLKKAESLA